MEKNLILTANAQREAIAREKVNNGIRHITHRAKQPIEWLRRYYSSVLEKPISTRQTWMLIEAQVAFVLGVLPADCPLLLRAICIGWFAWSVKRCKRAGI